MSSVRWRNDRREQAKRLLRSVAAEELSDGARELLRKANETVPIEEHVLEASGHVTPATPQHLVASVGYGGEASAYALRQHEDTTLRHDPGRRAKWLEATANEDGPRIMRAVGAGMARRLP